MHISLILDPDACIYDAVLFGNEPTNKAILGVGYDHISHEMHVVQQFNMVIG